MDTPRAFRYVLKTKYVSSSSAMKTLNYRSQCDDEHFECSPRAPSTERISWFSFDEELNETNIELESLSITYSICMEAGIWSCFKVGYALSIKNSTMSSSKPFATKLYNQILGPNRNVGSLFISFSLTTPPLTSRNVIDSCNAVYRPQRLQTPFKGINSFYFSIKDGVNLEPSNFNESYGF